MKHWTCLCLVAALALAWPAPVAGQQTRQDEIQRKRNEKAKQIKPEKRTKLEAALTELENGFFIERIMNPPRGFYPRIGGLGEGAGFGFGPGYRISGDRRGLRSDKPDFRISTAVSIKRYWIAEAKLLLPRLGSEWLFGELHARHRDFPQEDFYGIGPTSIESDRVNFGLRDTSFNGSLGVRVSRMFSVGGSLEHLTPRIGRGTDNRFPSIERLFSDQTAPGLAAQPDFVHTETFAVFDYSDPPLNPRAGGRYKVSYNNYNDRNLDRYSFDRWDFDLQQYVPFLHRHRTIALRAFVSLSDPEPGHDVPFYLQRTIGGAYTLRGFRSFRFRDLNLLLLQAEYRWEINPFLTGALFYDAGKVAPRRRDLDLNDLENNYGFGLRFGSLAGVFLRADVALGSREGTRFLLRFDNVF